LLGTVLPPLITLTIVSQFYTAFAANQYVQMVLKGMQCGVAAVILDVVHRPGLKTVPQETAFTYPDHVRFFRGFLYLQHQHHVYHPRGCVHRFSFMQKPVYN
jgi:chromate transport protein ChrA